MKIYFIVRILFGLYMIWLGLNYHNDLSRKQTYIHKSISFYKEDLFSTKILKSFNLPDSVIQSIQFVSYSTLDNLNKHTEELIYVITFLFLIGGLLCSLGFSTSSKFLQCAFYLDILFIHNFYFFRDERNHADVFKMIAILGGVSQLI